jgi:hypothetical protein
MAAEIKSVAIEINLPAASAAVVRQCMMRKGDKLAGLTRNFAIDFFAWQLNGA